MVKENETSEEGVEEENVKLMSDKDFCEHCGGNFAVDHDQPSSLLSKDQCRINFLMSEILMMDKLLSLFANLT